MKCRFSNVLAVTRHMLFACCLLPFFAGCDDASSSPESTSGVIIENNVFVDERDGNKYKMFNVGSDIWMAENLRYADSAASTNLAGNMWCPDGEASKCEQFGPLYSWTAARNISEEYSEKIYGKDFYKVQGVCPEGFRLPRKEDWLYLKKVAEKYADTYSVTENLRSPEGWESWGEAIGTIQAESQFVTDSILEVRVMKEKIPGKDKFSTEGFGFGITMTQNFEVSAVGFLPQGDTPNGENIGRLNMLSVKFTKTMK